MTAPTDRPRILLVEDEALNRTLVRAVLARAHIDAVRDAEIVEAHTLAHARELLGSGATMELVLLDMNLPDGNGLQLAREITDGPPGAPRPAVIAVTASVLLEDRDAARDAGCDGFLDKPYTAADLVTVVARHLPQRVRPD